MTPVQQLQGAFRRYAPVFAVAAAGFLLATLVIGATVPGADRTVEAIGEGGVVTLLRTTPAAVAVYALAPDGAEVAPEAPSTLPVSRPSCTLTRDGRPEQARGGYSSSRFTYEGTRMRRIFATASDDGRWRDGDALRCPGVGLMVVTSGSGRLARAALTGACAFVGLGALAFARYGSTLRRAAA